MRDLITLPKADLHVHLEGSVRAATAREFALASGAELPPEEWAFRDFEHFIDAFTLLCLLLDEPSRYRRIAYELCEDAGAGGVRWAEVRMTLPMARPDEWDDILEAVLDGYAAGEAAYGVRCRVVIDHARSKPVALAEARLAAALPYRDRGVVAFGIGGRERFRAEPFADVFRAARDGGLRSLPHAGEAEGPASIRGAIDSLGADRLGHGFRILEDPDLVDEVRDKKIPLEVCPTSNVATGVVASLDEHPLPRLLESGLVVTLNSDDPAMFTSPLLGEYEAARHVFGMDDAAVAALAREGVRASFAQPAIKAQLLREIDEWEDS